MAERLQLVGGPLDGHAIPRQRGRFAWVKGKLVAPARGGERPHLKGGAARVEPTNGAALYKRADDGSYIYEGHRRYYCNACGCYHGKAEGGREKRPCSLGGGEQR